jgi:hypothetical protein
MPISNSDIKLKNWVIEETRPLTSDPKACKRALGSISPQINVVIGSRNPTNAFRSNLFFLFIPAPKPVLIIT